MAGVVNRAGRPFSGQMTGLVIGLVVDNVDPDRLSRVKLKYPGLPGAPESSWARLTTPMAGANRGWVTIPEVGDEVLVSFMHGDLQHAVVVGSLYNGVDRPPYANEDQQNNLRVFQSRSGHRVTFDDSAGAERIELVTHNEEIRVVWDAANRALSVYCGGDIQIEARDHVAIKAEVFSVTAQDSVNIEAGQAIVVNAGEVLGVLGADQVQIQAPDVLVN